MSLATSGHWAQIMAAPLEAQILAVLHGEPQDRDTLISQHVSSLRCRVVALAEPVPNRCRNPISRWKCFSVKLQLSSSKSIQKIIYQDPEKDIMSHHWVKLSTNSVQITSHSSPILWTVTASFINFTLIDYLTRRPSATGSSTNTRLSPLRSLSSLRCVLQPSPRSSCLTFIFTL
jgi:hypothetical protein